MSTPTTAAAAALALLAPILAQRIRQSLRRAIEDLPSVLPRPPSGAKPKKSGATPRHTAGSNLHLPVINMSRWADSEGDWEARSELVEAVRRACEETGFLAITEVPERLRKAIRKAENSSKRYFELIKCKRELAEGNRFPSDADAAGLPKAYGYFPMRSEALGYKADVERKPDLREAFSMGPTMASKRFETQLAKPFGSYPYGDDFNTDVVRFLFQPTPWKIQGDSKEETKILQDFKEGLTSFYHESSQLGATFLRIIALALDLPENHFEKAASQGEHCNSARAILYPELTREASKGQFRCGPHSDTGAVTLLWSDSPGLELQPKCAGGGSSGEGDSNQWCPVENLLLTDRKRHMFGDPGTLIVNIGNLLEYISKGKWKSTPHRVPAPPCADQRLNQDRLVLVNFIILAPDFQVDAKGLTQGEHAFSQFIRKGRNRKEA